jgi:hypothetical protein
MKDAMTRTPVKELVVCLESPFHWPRVVERPALGRHAADGRQSPNALHLAGKIDYADRLTHLSTGHTS